MAKAVRDPRKAAHVAVKLALRNGCVGLTSRVQIGTNILDRDWDVCIILDTCRVDALRRVADEYDFLTDVSSVLSLGGSSPEWMINTFDVSRRDVLGRTGYLTANAWTERVLFDRLRPQNKYSDFSILRRLVRFGHWDLIDPDHLARLEKIWEYVPTEDQLTEDMDPGDQMPGGAPPRYVTDRAISVARSGDCDRLILHYMQPHAPYVSAVVNNDRELKTAESEPFEFLRETGDRQRVWEAYLDELRYVLDSVAVLLRNLSADKVVITADHGEAFGEWGVYNHWSGSVHPHVRRVPWAVTSATDTGSYEPEVDMTRREDQSVDDQLKALGYRT